MAGAGSSGEFGGLKVLLVDDNRDSATTLARLLEGFGCRTVACFDGASALASARTFGPDLVILDVRLPDMSGTEVCSRMRAMPALADTTFVAHTGAADQRTLDDVRAAGFHRILCKPVELDAILDALKSAGPAA